MAYIGKQPIVGNFVKLDTITATATTTFNLLNGGVAYFPQSANNCLVSLNGILQAPTDSYTISGSTIIFSSALTTSDVIDFIIVLGDVLNIGTPSDNTVSLAKLTATGTKSSSTFLRGDNTFASAGGNNTPAFYATRTSSNQSLSDLTWTKAQVNSELFDSDGCYDNATNYRFTPTTAGKYVFFANSQMSDNNSAYESNSKFYKNGSATTEQTYTYIPNTGVFSQMLVAVFDMNGTTDYVELYVRGDSTNTTPLYATGSNFGAFKLIGA
jgi:hypothetical protein